MFYLNFIIITDTPARLANFLVSRNIITQTVNTTGDTVYIGVLPGMEWVRVPNPIQTSPGPPPVYDTRAVFLVKFAHESEADQEAGQTVAGNQYDWSKFGKWVKANSTIVDAPANYKINGVWAGQAYKINAQNVWLVRDNPERFGVWQ